MDRRAIFFLCSGVVCALLVSVTPTEMHWVGEVMAIAFGVLAVASWMDAASRRRSGR